MDPAKRICLKNLPDSCTKREIAELIRNRTGTTIHSIDLGQDNEGRTRRYAHFSCEGAKHVLELLGEGIMLRSNLVHALPAKPHYTYKYAEARRKRERDEAAAQEAIKLYWEHIRAMMEKRGTLGEISTKRKTRNFYEARRRYALIASQIAEQYRAKHKKLREAKQGKSNEQHPSANNNISNNIISNNNNNIYLRENKKYESDGSGNALSTAINGKTVYSPGPSSSSVQEMTSSTSASHFNDKRRKVGENAKKQSSRGNTKNKFNAKRAQKANAKVEHSSATSAPAVVVVSTPPPPSRDERKLTGLQAKLAALKQKLAKK